MEISRPTSPTDLEVAQIMCNRENFISAPGRQLSIIAIDNGLTSNRDDLPKIHCSFSLFRPIKGKDAEAEMAKILRAESEVMPHDEFDDCGLRYSSFSPVPLSEDEVAYKMICNQGNVRNASNKPPVIIVFENGLTSDQEESSEARLSFSIFQPIEIHDSLMEKTNISGVDAKVNPDEESDESRQRYSGFSPVSSVSRSEIRGENKSWGISSRIPLVGKEKAVPISSDYNTNVSETEGRYLGQNENNMNCGFKRSQKRKRSRDEESPVGTFLVTQIKRKRLIEGELSSDTFSPAKIGNLFAKTKNISNAAADFDAHRYFTSPRWSPVDLPDDDSYEVDTENDSRKLYWTDSGEYIWYNSSIRSRIRCLQRCKL